ncbi:MAG: hypothetical protein ACOYNM_06900 [Gemmataceae bacterium]
MFSFVLVLFLLFLWNPYLFKQKEELEPNEKEIAWIYPASYSSAWERLVSSGKLLANHPDPFLAKVKFELGSHTFPELTASVPFFKISHPNSKLTIVVKWYKISSDMKYEDWVEKLFSRSIIPSAIVAGPTTDDAMAIVQAVAKVAAKVNVGKAPPLILTTASSNTLAKDFNGTFGPNSTDDIGLMGIYPEKTFRFGFDNRIMSDAIIRLLWSNPDLKPDSDPVHIVLWEDDSYARDFVATFWASLNKQTVADGLAAYGWACSTVFAQQNTNFAFLLAPPLQMLGKKASSFSMNMHPIPQIIDSSIGVRYAANRFEKEALRFLLLDIKLKPEQTQPLMVVGSQALQARRFLRELSLSDPKLARKMVVVTGDTLSLNTVYRDREVAWPVSELPSKVVFFSHANPVSHEAGFRPINDWADTGHLAKATSTEELIFSSQILEGLLPGLFIDTGDLSLYLKKLTWDGDRVTVEKGTPLFDAAGNRNAGTGEFIGVLKPLLDPTDRASAKLEIWSLLSQGKNQLPLPTLRSELLFSSGANR